MLEIELTQEWERVFRIKPISWIGFLQNKKLNADRKKDPVRSVAIQELIDSAI